MAKIIQSKDCIIIFCIQSLGLARLSFNVVSLISNMSLFVQAVSDPNIPDAIIFYTVYLLELALTLPNPDGNKRVSIWEEASH